MGKVRKKALNLPTKRTALKAGAGSSGSEASKKPKLDSRGEIDWEWHDEEYWQLGKYEDFCAFCNRSDEFRERYDYDDDNSIYEWKHYLLLLQYYIKLREMKLYLRSEGRVEDADELQSLDDKQAYKIHSSHDFGTKGWLLRPNPGRLNDYQRLYVADSLHYIEDGELEAKYGHLFCTYASDLAFLKFVKELPFLIKWDLDCLEAIRIGEDASKKYKDLDPEIVVYAVQYARDLNRKEQLRKERVPFFTKLWLGVVREERDAIEVLTEIMYKGVASFPVSVEGIEDQLWNYENWEEYPPCLRIFEPIKRYIHDSSKGKCLGENEIEELIRKYFDVESPSGPVVSAYATYLEEKLAVAEKLGLTSQRQKSRCAGFRNHDAERLL